MVRSICGAGLVVVLTESNLRYNNYPERPNTLRARSLEQVDGPVWVGQHERIKIRTVGAVPVEGWVTPDARPQGPVFMVAMTAEDVDVRCR